MDIQDLKKFKTVSFAVAIGLLAFLSANILLKRIGEFSRNINSDIFEAATTFSVTVKNLLSKNTEHQRLYDESGELVTQAAEIEFLRKENNELKKALGFKETYGQEVMLVSSIGFYRLFGNEILMINHGSESGIRRGDIVFADGKIYVGRVLSVKEGASDVLLASSRSESIDAVFAGLGLRTRARGLSGGEFAVDFVPNESGINKGEFLWFLPRASHEPGNLLLGEVRSVSPTANGVFMDIRATHFFNALKPSSLFVVLSPEPK